MTVAATSSTSGALRDLLNQRCLVARRDPGILAIVSSSFTELAIDCADPGALASFWCAVLGYEVRGTGADAGLVTIGSTTDHRAVTLTFAQVPEAKTVKNRLHLDLNPGDRTQEQEVERLVGARREVASMSARARTTTGW